MKKIEIYYGDLVRIVNEKMNIYYREMVRIVNENVF